MVGPNPVTGVLRRFEHKTHKEECHVTMETEIEIMHLRAKKCQGFLATTRTGKGME